MNPSVHQSVPQSSASDGAEPRLSARNIEAEFRRDFSAFSTENRFVVIDAATAAKARVGPAGRQGDPFLKALDEHAGIVLTPSVQRRVREQPQWMNLRLFHACALDLTELGVKNTQLVIAPESNASWRSDMWQTAYMSGLPIDPIDEIQYQHFIVDHEIGHVVDLAGSRKDFKSVHEAESVADAYATLRHRQRYGWQSELPAHKAILRTLAALHNGDIAHETSDAITIADASARQLGDALFKLSPEQLLVKAQRIGRSVAFTEKQENAYREVMGFGFAPLIDQTALAPTGFERTITRLTGPVSKDLPRFIQGRLKRYQSALQSLAARQAAGLNSNAAFLAQALHMTEPHGVTDSLQGIGADLSRLADLNVARPLDGTRAGDVLTSLKRCALALCGKEDQKTIDQREKLAIEKSIDVRLAQIEDKLPGFGKSLKADIAAGHLKPETLYSAEQSQRMITTAMERLRRTVVERATLPVAANDEPGMRFQHGGRRPSMPQLTR